MGTKFMNIINKWDVKFIFVVPLNIQAMKFLKNQKKVSETSYGIKVANYKIGN